MFRCERCTYIARTKKKMLSKELRVCWNWEEMVRRRSYTFHLNDYLPWIRHKASSILKWKTIFFFVHSLVRFKTRRVCIDPMIVHEVLSDPSALCIWHAAFAFLWSEKSLNAKKIRNNEKHEGKHIAMAKRMRRTWFFFFSN